ncbi:hypothetical protein [Yinghuangia soli]|uniref:Uncharacterized protein n=1 Tax=Yinghuangia soli TaxID=2908204 RepID=A0AA41TZI6_9ACTN|nr:hypothetical protein [Yinghuangia soli]MCF2527325.1 hypothetical protein [Yinghuangia soli]
MGLTVRVYVVHPDGSTTETVAKKTLVAPHTITLVADPWRILGPQHEARDDTEA